MPEAVYNEKRFSEIDLLQDLQAILTKEELNQVVNWLSGDDIALSESIKGKLKIYFNGEQHD